uniref:Endo/exonuclease/phosphatase domain-containing protein n=1 Tax=Rhabditophanes sp. KR3021 TaxID=114890 RepID=A0AC35TSG5_9BILA
MDRLKIDVLFVCETKRKELTCELAFESSGTESNEWNQKSVTCFFGNFDKIGGTGYMIADHLKSYVVFSKFVGARLGRLDFDIGGIIVACIIVYAPTLQSTETLLDEFYNNLDDLCKERRYDKLIIGGDYNSRIASSYKKKKSRLTFAEESNANGDLMAENKILTSLLN